MRADDQAIKLLELSLQRTIDTTILKLFSIQISGKVRRVTEMQRENIVISFQTVTYPIIVYVLPSKMII